MTAYLRARFNTNPQHIHQSRHQRQRMRRTNRHVRHRHIVLQKQPLHLRRLRKKPAGNRAGAQSQDKTRARLCVKAELQRLGHVVGNGTTQNQAIGVARRGDELDAVTAEVEVDVADGVQFRFAAVAAARGHRAQAQRPAELFFERRGSSAL